MARVSQADNDFIAMPPPGAPEAEKPAVAPPATDSTDDFISLPPGIALDSGTFKIPARKPTEAPAPDIVFVPTVLGAAPVLPAAVAEPTPVAAPAAPVAVAAVEPRLAWRLVLPGGGDPIHLDGTVLVGRNPAASVDWPNATLLGVADSTRSVSKTHALLEVDGDDLWVHDLGSTNGVFIVVSEEEVVEVAVGTRAPLASGVDLELGDYVVRVERG